MARGGGHHSHHSSHHSSFHSHHSHYHHHYGRSVYGRGNGGKTDEERRQERRQVIIVICIYFLIILWMELELSLAEIFSLPRSPLPAGSVKETVYYTDEYGYVNDSEVLTQGMEYFFEKTGVQPYVYYTDAGSFYGSYYTMSGMDSLYNSLFQDEGHFLLIITGDITGYPSHHVSYYYGADVDRVMDEEAIDLFFENFDNEALKQTSADVVISNAFRKTANDLTGIRAYGVGYIILFILLLGAIAACIIAFVQKYRQHKMNQIIKESKDRDQILFDDMPEELHAPERMMRDAVKQAELLAEKEKESGQKEIWGPTISWDDALRDMQENEAEEAAQVTQNVADASPIRNKSDMVWAQSEKTDQRDTGRIEETRYEDKGVTFFEERQRIEPEKERADKDEDMKEQHGDGYIPSVDWGFSMDKGIDLFSDEKNDKK